MKFCKHFKRRYLNYFLILSVTLLLICSGYSYAHAEETSNAAVNTATTSANTDPNAASSNTTAQEMATQLNITVNAASGKNTSYLKDASYATYTTYSADDSLTITSEQAMYGIYIIWSSPCENWTLSYNGTTKTCGTNGYLHEYVAIPEGTTSCTVSFSKSETICDIYAYSQGTLPSDVEVWKPSCNNADILVFSTHADDEILFLGGVLATYGGEQNDRVQVVYMTNYWNGTIIREHEKLDGLWASGIKYYPVNGDFDDLYATNLEGAKKVYNYDSVVSFVTSQIRRFKPLVVVTQDLNGEYGHGGHMLLANATIDSVNSSMIDTFCPESAASYGTWDVPKTYLHLYNENTISLNLRVPLEKFGGQNAIEVEAAAYKKHVSQQWCWFYVSDEYEYSCADFGLFRSTVGNDNNNDMLEHVTTYGEQERLAKEAAEAASIAQSEAESKSEAESISAVQASEKSAQKTSNIKTVIIIIVIVAVLLICVILVYINNQKKNRRRRKKRRRR